MKLLYNLENVTKRKTQGTISNVLLMQAIEPNTCIDHLYDVNNLRYSNEIKANSLFLLLFDLDIGIFIYRFKHVGYIFFIHYSF